MTVEPSAPRLLAGDVLPFVATVTGTANTSVSWAVVEPGGGTIDANGVYTAPASAGTFRVRATSVADTQASGESVVTVRLPVTISVSPAAATVQIGGTIAFTATVANATDTAATWSVAGTGCGSVSAAGLYTAPATARTCSVVATSRADPTRSATAVVTVVTTAPPPVTVSVTPSPAATNTCRTVSFSATVSGAADTSVDWSVQEGAVGGTVTAAGVYTAPQDAGTYHVVATSRADRTRSAVATVTVTDRILSVTVAPAQTTLAPGATAQFTATVTTTCGSYSSSTTLGSAGGLTAAQ